MQDVDIPFSFGNIRYLLLIQNNFLFGISDYVYLLFSYGNELFFPLSSRLIQTKQMKFVLSGYIVQNNLLELHCSCMSLLSGTSTKYFIK